MSITTTFATDRWMKLQSTVCAGWFRSKTAPSTIAAAELKGVLLA